MDVRRRQFLLGGVGATVLASLPADLLADQGAPPAAVNWDSGQVRHLLPTVSDTGVVHRCSYDDDHGELAHTIAVTAPTANRMPPAASVCMKSRNGESARGIGWGARGERRVTWSPDLRRPDFPARRQPR